MKPAKLCLSGVSLGQLAFYYEYFFVTVMFDSSSYTVTEGTDKFVELIIHLERSTDAVVIVNVSFVPGSAEGRLPHTL